LGTRAVVFLIDTEFKTADPFNRHDRSQKPKRGKLVHLVVWVALFALVVIGIYLIVGQGSAVKARPVFPTAITTGTAQKGNIGVYIDAIGTVTPVYTASIFSQVTGNVMNVRYQEGQLVQKGDPLIDIDDRQYQATLLQAQGTLERDQNVLAQAQMDLTRYQDAWARNALAKQTLDDQEKIVLQDTGTVKNDQGAVAYDQLQVDYCHIVAPFSGQTGLRLVDPGNLVSAGSGGSSATPLVVITQVQPITVIFTIPEGSLESVLAQIHKGATLSVDAYDSADQTKLATGQLLALDNQIDTTTGTLKLRAQFGNENYVLYPNQFVNIRLLVQTLEGVTLVPAACIQQNGDTSYVYVVQDGAVHETDITPGVSENGVTQVTGINPGDVIADSSFDKLQDGGKVNIAGPTGSPGAGGGHGAHGGGSPRAGHSPHAHHSPQADN
jgi:multidrug efflux system membrane fusion protein